VNSVLKMMAVAFLMSLPCAMGQDADSVQRTYQQAQQALAEGNYSVAEQAYEKLAKIDPNTAEVHANLGLIYFEKRKFGPAIPEFRQALKLKPSLVKTSYLLAMSLAEVGRYADALPGLEKGFHQTSDAATKRICGLQLERTYSALQRDGKAVEVALDLNRLYPNDPEILYHNGKIFGNFAFLSMQKLVQVAPDSVWRHRAGAEADESQGFYDVAINEYRQVLAAQPHQPGVHYRLGRTLLARSHQTHAAEDIAAAEEEFKREIEIDPTNANSAYETGEIERDAGHIEDAQKYFELALQSYPDFEEAHLGLAAVLTAQQKAEAALPHLQKAIALKRDDEVAWYRLAQVLGILGHSTEQQRAMSEFQRLHAQNATPQSSGKTPFSSDEVTSQQIDGPAK
jgi:tetratricopeptide (TPR) repeat protein